MEKPEFEEVLDIVFPVDEIDEEVLNFWVRHMITSNEVQGDLPPAQVDLYGPTRLSADSRAHSTEQDD